MTAFALALIIGLATVPSSSVQAQSADSLGSRFFQVSITRNSKPLLASAYFHDSDDVLIIQGPPLAEVIARAYGLQPYQIVDGPEWIHTSHLYDIRATPPPADFADSDEAMMLQDMLADRFKLTVEPSRREITVQALMVSPDAKPEAVPAGATGRGILSIDSLANHLSLTLGQPVLNLTGLSAIRIDRPLPIPALNPEVTLAAMRDQLGLMLEPQAATTLEVLIVTDVEHPDLED